MVPKVQYNILKNLAKYKFLSRKQMKRLGIAASNSNLGHYCKGLLDAKYIGLINGKDYGLGYMYYLAKKGARLLEQKNELSLSINYFDAKPKSQPSTLWHSHNSIYCQIECDIVAFKKDYSFDFYIKDIDRMGKSSSQHSKYTKATSIDVSGEILEPDACFLIQNRLFAFEYENQTYTKRSFHKMIFHCEALKQRSLGKQYQLQKEGRYKLHRVLVVYEKQNVLENTIKRMNKELNDNLIKGKWFLFKHISEVLPKVTWNEPVTETLDYFDDWLTLSGERVNMFS